MNIKMKNIISISEARSKIFEIAEKVQKLGEIFTFTENGKPKVVMMSAEEYENIIEDMALMKNRKFMAKVERAAEEFANGEYLSWESVKKDLSINSGRKRIK
jgi:prevent-host-death family protein